MKSYVTKTGRAAPIKSIKKMYVEHAYCSSIQHYGFAGISFITERSDSKKKRKNEWFKIISAAFSGTY
ncbi:hypothetical protein [Ferruginibacter sp.]|uniref:hypothetical protein n=1 Tax=Ferruginibacter sp. TaxID=1940288 RepID=UPI00265847AC|nr:hypothetical protein [Ferruginibacter sp.]